MKLDQAKTRPLSTELESKKSISRRVSLLSEGLRNEIVYLDVDLLIPYQRQARQNFDETELQSLANTIKEHGVRQPLTVLKSDIQPDCFEVVSGERRLRASKLVGLKKVPCIILANKEQAEEIALVENIQRQDLHPIELARALKTLIDKLGWGAQSELEKKIGISQPQISELLKLMELSKKVQDAAIRKNYRSRDNLRGLFRLKTEVERLEAIEKAETQKENLEHNKTFSILRLSYNQDSIKVQKNALKKLTLEQKKKVKAILEEVLSDLETE